MNELDRVETEINLEKASNHFGYVLNVSKTLLRDVCKLKQQNAKLVEVLFNMYNEAPTASESESQAVKIFKELGLTNNDYGSMGKTLAEVKGE